MTGLQDRLIADLKTAMREGDTVRREAIRMLRAAVLNEELDLQRQAFEQREAAGPAQPGADAAASAEDAIPRRNLTDEEIGRVIERVAKRHQDSIEHFERANRTDLVAHEQAQLAVIRGYLEHLPGRMSGDELTARVREAIASVGAKGRGDSGKVMQRLAADLRGKADLKEVSRLVQEQLGA